MTSKQWRTLILGVCLIIALIAILWVNVLSMDAKLKHATRGTNVTLKIGTEEQIEDREDSFNLLLALLGEGKVHIDKLYSYSDGIVVLKLSTKEEAQRLVDCELFDDCKGKYAAIYTDKNDPSLKSKIHSIMKGW